MGSYPGGFVRGFLFHYMKEGYYFPHFSNARSDRKVQRLMLELGIEGYGIFFMLLEVLREQEDLSYPIADIDLLARQFGTSEQKVNVTICNYGLFEVQKTESGEVFFSPKLLAYLEPFFAAKKQRKDAIEARWAKYRENKSIDNQQVNTAVLRPNNGNDTGVIQRKENKSKVNEIKVKDIECVPQAAAHTPELLESFKNFNAWLKEKAPRVLQLKNQITIDEYARIKEVYPNMKLPVKTLIAMHNYKPLTSKYVDAYLTLKKWIQKEAQ